MTGEHRSRRVAPVLLLAIIATAGLWGCAEPKLEKIQVAPEEAVLHVGESESFKATPLSNKGDVMPGVTVRWSVEGEAGSVDQSGRFVAQKPGQAEVIAAGEGITGKARVRVNPRALARFQLEPEKTAALPGSAVTVRLKGFTADNEPAGYNEVALTTSTEGASLSTQTIPLDPAGEGEFILTLSPEPGSNVVLLQSGEVTQELRLDATEVVRLEILPREGQFEAGQEISFEALALDEHGNQAAVTADWSISGESAEIKDGSTVLMREPGRGILLAKYRGITQGRPFTVVLGKVARLEIEPSGVELQAGQSAGFSARGFNAQGHPLPVRVQWVVEGDVGTIAPDGTFLARTVGKGTVNASSDAVSAQVPVEVQHGPLADIAVEIPTRQLRAGETIDLKAEGVDAYGNRFPIGVQWSLSRSIGTINQQESTFNALHTGTGEIRASVGNILKSVGVEVSPAELARLQIAPQNLDIAAGEQIRFEVEGFDRFGNQVEVEPEFSMDEALGELKPSGEFKADRAGSTVVRARVKDLSVESTLAVVPAEVVEVSIRPEGPVELIAGKTQEFKAFGIDSFGNIVESTVQWSVHPDLGTMDDQGLLFPKRAGKGEVIVALTQIPTGKVLEARISVSVDPGETSRIDIQPSDVQTTAGRETPFSATAYDQFGNETGVAVSWALSEPALGSISENGVFSAIKAGSGKVLARYENVMSESLVKISPAEIAFLKIVPEALSLQAGEKVELKALGEDRFGNVVDAHVLWSLSDTSLGTIMSGNVFTAKKQGKGHLVATSRNIVDLAPLEVKPGPLVSLQVLPGDPVVRSGENITFEAVGLDAAGNPLEIIPQWSVEEQLGAIQQNGAFTARKAGAGEVAATFEGIRGSARIRVIPGAPAAIKVEPKEITMAAGNREEISVEVHDASGNLIPEPNVQWELEKGLGTLVEVNRFHAGKTGQEIIRLTAGNVTAQVPVTITAGRVHLIRMHPPEATLTAGDKVVFAAKAFDAEGNDVPLTPAWAVGGAVGSVSEDGVFQAVRVGSGHVSVQMEGVVAMAPVTVQPGPVARIVVTPESVAADAGDTLDFTAAALDAQGNVTPSELSWAISPEESGRALATAGSFQVLKAGESTVTASADGIRGAARVRIAPGAVTELFVSPPQIGLNAGESIEVSVSARDAYGNEPTLSPEYAVAPTHLGTVSQGGVFTALKPGEGQLVASVQGLRTAVPLEVRIGTMETLTVVPPSEEIVAGKTYQFRALGHDKGGNDMPAQVNWAVTEGIGRIELESGVFHATKAGQGMVVAYGHGLTAEKAVEVKPGELHRFFIEPNPVEVRSGTTQTFQVRGFDIEENAVPVVVSALSWNEVGGIGVFEEAGTFRGTRMGKGKVTATLGALGAEAYVTVVPGKPDSGNSRVRVIYPVLASDGRASSEVIVEVRDFYNNPVPDVQATLVSNRQVDTIVQPPRTNQQGLARGRVSSTQPGTSIFSVVIQGQTIRDTARVTFE